MIVYDENELDRELTNSNSQRKIINEPGDSTWGQLIIPGKNENPNKSKKGMKLLLMASYRTGLLLLQTLIEFEKRYPDRLNIVGLITDDPLSPDARISMKRRIWRFFNDEEKLNIEDAIIETALSNGIPCYTGAVKTKYGSGLLKTWNPDAIEVFVFGQIIDSPFINMPKYGIYNYHPADLLNHHGAGPRPYQDLIERNATTSKFTIHQLSLELDSGNVLGQSPDIYVKYKNGKLPKDLLIIEDKMMAPMDFMSILLTRQLILNKEKGEQGKIETLDFTNYFNADQKKELLKPIISKENSKELPGISTYAINLLNNLW